MNTGNHQLTGISPRSLVRVGERWVVKRYRSEEAARQEAMWYEAVPWAAPELIAVDGPDLILPSLPVAADMPQWRPAKELSDLLRRLEAEGVHHRDVHTKNLVMDGEGYPLLIDWETAVQQDAPCSYDLYGPEASGVPLPPLHADLGLGSQWWGSPQRFAIGYEWETGPL